MKPLRKKGNKGVRENNGIPKRRYLPGTINVGDGMTGAMIIDGSFDQLSAAVTNIVFGSTLTFTDADPDIQGTLNLNGTVSSDTVIAIDGGTLNSAAGVTNAIVGSIGVYNSGVINVGTSSTDGSGAGILTQTSGASFVIGSKEADLSPTGGTLNLYTGSALTFPAATDTTEVVITAGGVVNMYGAGIAMATSRVADLQLDTGEETMPAAVLYSYSNIMGSPTNTISGSVVNNGLIAFQGLLNGLAITLNSDGTGGSYTQGSDGTLSMRLDNGPADDGLAVAGTATLGGTLTLSALNDLTANQKWTLIAANGKVFEDFATINWPDSSGAWLSIGGGAGGTPTYDVSN